MGTQMRIRPAKDGELERLQAIAIAAKCHWGYPPAMVQGWADVDLTPAALSARRVFVADVGDQAVGWASLIQRGELCVLDDLWVDPDWMGQGIGTDLFAHALDQARATGASRMEWEAEPNASGFYAKVGGRYLRDSEPTAFGRVLAVMGVDV